MGDLRCPGFDPIWGEIIDDFEKCDAKLAAKWAKRLCAEGKFHHGAYNAVGNIGNGVPFEEAQSCWNCQYEVRRVNKRADAKEVILKALTHKAGDEK